MAGSLDRYGMRYADWVQFTGPWPQVCQAGPVRGWGKKGCRWLLFAH